MPICGRHADRNPQSLNVSMQAVQRFEFRLESLLKYRRYRRDVLQSLYAGLLAQQQTMVAARVELSGHRDAQLDEMRTLVSPGQVDVSAASSRRFHTARIAAELLQRARDLDELEQQLILCRSELTKAEQDVEAVEKLKEKQRREFEYEQGRREQVELEDAWMSARAGELAAK